MPPESISTCFVLVIMRSTDPLAQNGLGVGTARVVERLKGVRLLLELLELAPILVIDGLAERVEVRRLQ